jgi:hypothetical protein
MSPQKLSVAKERQRVRRGLPREAQARKGAAYKDGEVEDKVR